MSTYFEALKKILASELFDGRLGKFGVYEHIHAHTSETHRCLSDGRSYLCVSIMDDGFVGCISCYGGNAPGKILGSITEAFDADIVSEYEPQYWGYATQEEWDAASNELNEWCKDEAYKNYMKYLRGEENDLEPGTVGMRRARIAEQLVAKNPDLLLPQNKDRLLKEIVEEDYGQSR